MNVKNINDINEIKEMYSAFKNVIEKHNLEFCFAADKNDLSFENEGFIVFWNLKEQKFWIYFGNNCSCFYWKSENNETTGDGTNYAEINFEKVSDIKHVVELTKNKFNINNSDFLSAFKNHDEYFIRRNYGGGEDE